MKFGNKSSQDQQIYKTWNQSLFSPDERAVNCTDNVNRTRICTISEHLDLHRGTSHWRCALTCRGWNGFCFLSLETRSLQSRSSPDRAGGGDWGGGLGRVTTRNPGPVMTLRRDKTLHEGRPALFVLINVMIALEKPPLSQTGVGRFFRSSSICQRDSPEEAGEWGWEGGPLSAFNQTNVGNRLTLLNTLILYGHRRSLFLSYLFF